MFDIVGMESSRAPPALLEGRRICGWLVVVVLGRDRMAYRPAAEALIGCVRLPRFAVQVERWRFPELAAVPLALIGRPSSRRSDPAATVVVVACSREAEAEGLRIGMPLREARAAAPDVTLREAD